MDGAAALAASEPCPYDLGHPQRPLKCLLLESGCRDYIPQWCCSMFGIFKRKVPQNKNLIHSQIMKVFENRQIIDYR